MEQHTSEDARRDWRRILNAVEGGGQVEITRYGKPLAVVVPVEWRDRAAAALEGTSAPLASSFQPGDVIAVPPEVIKVTAFRDTSRLVIRQRKPFQHEGECKSCGTAIKPGDLYAASTEPTSGRCIRCVDGWPLAEPLKGMAVTQSPETTETGET